MRGGNDAQASCTRSQSSSVATVRGCSKSDPCERGRPIGRVADAATQATVTRAMEMQAMGTRATARRAPYTLEVGKAVGLSRVGCQASCETPFEWRRGTAADSTTASALTAERVAKRRSDNLQRERL